MVASPFDICTKLYNVMCSTCSYQNTLCNNMNLDTMLKCLDSIEDRLYGKSPTEEEMIINDSELNIMQSATGYSATIRTQVSYILIKYMPASRIAYIYTMSPETEDVIEVHDETVVMEIIFIENEGCQKMLPAFGLAQDVCITSWFVDEKDVMYGEPTDIGLLTLSVNDESKQNTDNILYFLGRYAVQISYTDLFKEYNKSTEKGKERI